MYFSGINCSGNRYTAPGNFSSAQAGGFGSSFEEQFIVFEKGGTAELIVLNTTPVSTTSSVVVKSFYYVGECWNSDLANMDINDYYDLPNAINDIIAYGTVYDIVADLDGG